MSDSSWDALYLAQRGSSVFRLEARGIAGHSADAVAVQERAGWALARALTALAEAELFRGACHPLDGSPPLVNLATMVSGGITPWQHPHTLEATIEIRTVPGMTADSVTTELREPLRREGLDGRVTISPVGWSVPTRPAEDARLMSAVSAGLDLALGHVPRTAVFPATTDAVFLDAIGIPTIPALGPGSLRDVHQPNESLPVRDLEVAAGLIVGVCRAWRTHPPFNGRPTS